MAPGHFEWLASIIVLILGWVFVPFYLRSNVYTMPEFLERRYNGACRTYLASISLIAYVFTKIAVAIFAGAIVLKAVLGWGCGKVRWRWSSRQAFTPSLADWRRSFTLKSFKR